MRSNLVLAVASVLLCPGCWLFHERPGDTPIADAGPRDAARPPLLDAAPAPADAGTDAATACVDPDPCVRAIPAGSGCVLAPEPDGTPCDDGLACTVDDQCVARVCTGDPIPEPHDVLALASTFGSLRAVAAPMGEGRVLFGDPLRRASALTLVDARAGLARRDRYVLDQLRFYDGTGALVARVGARTVAWVDVLGRTLRIVERTVDDHLVVHAPFDLGAASSQPRRIVAAGDDLWLCAGRTLRRIGIADPDAPEDRGFMVLDGTCEGLAARVGRVFASTENGSFVVDVPADPTRPPVLGPRLGRRSSILDAADGRVLLAGRAGTTIYRDTDLAQLAHLDGLTAGAVLVDRGVVLARPAIGASGGGALDLELYSLGAGGLVLLDRERIFDVTYRFEPERDALATDGTIVVDGWTRRVFAVEGDALVERHDAQHGEIHSMHVDGDEISTRSRYGAARFQIVSGAIVPRAGRAHGAPRLTLEVREDGAMELSRHVEPSTFDDLSSYVSELSIPEVIAVRRFDDAQRAITVREVTLPGGPSVSRFLGGDLVRGRITDRASGRARFEVHRGADLATGNAAPEASIQAGPIRGLPGIDLDHRVHLAFDVDPAFDRIVAAVAGYERVPGAVVGALMEIALPSGAVVAQGPLDVAPSSVAAHGDRVAVCDAFSTLVTFVRDGDTMREIARVPLEHECGGLFAFDGALLHVATAQGVEVRTFAAPSTVVTTYLLDDTVSDHAWVEDGLLVSTRTGLALLEPACGASAP
ncbi:hypothetical protein [Sandaracinus amylolyticus]|uniref:Uncharacterized protein n=1 Tax=Sandaracinus amylolyticus TaxID=927083 RepID=A0A0F6W061_9BACT|nr:hypothetical protein [Sandaracinus amylolyticus]AKF04100.1 hypothetical protein DB32_001249 [Sandaracinus amylolyticus]